MTSVENSIVHHVMSEEGNATASVLTPKQWAILNCLQQGYSTKQTYGALFMSQRTFFFHRTAILQRLNCKTLYQAVYVSRALTSPVVVPESIYSAEREGSE